VQATSNLDNVKEGLKKAIDDERTAEANTHKAKTDLQFYTVEVGRYKLLSQQGAVSMEDLDTHTQAYNAGVANLDAMTHAEASARATIKSQTAAVRVADAALQTAKANYEQIAATRSFKKVTALFDGIVTQRNVDAGALVTSGSNSTNTVLFEIARTDVLRILVYVPEQYVPDIHLNEEALLNVEEYPDKDFVGIVSHIAGGIDPTSKTLQVEIHVPNSDTKLLPGMYVQVRFRSPSLARMATVPATTAQIRADGTFMYTVDEKNIIHVHKVEIGRDLGGQFEIVHGIAPGDKVVVSPSDELRDGELVNAVMAPTAPKSDGK
jgi:RND family efflux transporter MFP subunit